MVNGSSAQRSVSRHLHKKFRCQKRKHVYFRCFLCWLPPSLPHSLYSFLCFHNNYIPEIEQEARCNYFYMFPHRLSAVGCRMSDWGHAAGGATGGGVAGGAGGEGRGERAVGEWGGVRAWGGLEVLAWVGVKTGSRWNTIRNKISIRRGRNRRRTCVRDRNSTGEQPGDPKGGSGEGAVETVRF